MRTPSHDSPHITTHSGFPNAGLDQSLGTLNIHQLLIHNPSGTFLMEVSGHEWEADGIFDTDILVIDRTLIPRDGDRIVWWNDDTFVISRATMLPHDTQQWGIVTAVIHRYRQ